ncbi:hypothetical protein [Pannonibacter phragmitetus]|uniref:hypothetical protein n=1 Tax=Pannonibacter phragmitetus TaxID=121719 RepID=UPI003D2EEBD7
MDTNGDDHLVGKAERLHKHVEMAVGDGIEGSSVKGGTCHGKVIAPLVQTGKPSRHRTCGLRKDGRI